MGSRLAHFCCEMTFNCELGNDDGTRRERFDRQDDCWYPANALADDLQSRRSLAIVPAFGCCCGPHRSGSGIKSSWSIKPRKWANAVKAIVLSLSKTPVSMLRSSAASVRLAEVTKSVCSSAITALA